MRRRLAARRHAVMTGNTIIDDAGVRKGGANKCRDTALSTPLIGGDRPRTCVMTACTGVGGRYVPGRDTRGNADVVASITTCRRLIVSDGL